MSSRRRSTRPRGDDFFAVPSTGPSELEVTHTNNPMVRNNFELVPLGRQAQQRVDNHEGSGDDDDTLDNLHDIDLDTEARFGMI